MLNIEMDADGNKPCGPLQSNGGGWDAWEAAEERWLAMPSEEKGKENIRGSAWRICSISIIVTGWVIIGFKCKLW